MQQQWLQQIQASQDLATLDDLRVHLLGKSGLVTQQLKTLGALSPEERKAKGAEINALKDRIALAIEEKKIILETQVLELRLANEKIDITLPSALNPGVFASQFLRLPFRF